MTNSILVTTAELSEAIEIDQKTVWRWGVGGMARRDPETRHLRVTAEDLTVFAAVALLWNETPVPGPARRRVAKDIRSALKRKSALLFVYVDRRGIHAGVSESRVELRGKHAFIWNLTAFRKRLARLIHKQVDEGCDRLSLVEAPTLGEFKVAA